MRSVNLLKIAAEAEFLRQRAMLARQLRRAAFGFLALIFALGVLITAEIAAWQGLHFYVAALTATLLLLGLNLVIAAGLSVPAVRSHPTPQEQEALRVRQQALEGARAALTLTALLRLCPGFCALAAINLDEAEDYSTGSGSCSVLMADDLKNRGARCR